MPVVLRNVTSYRMSSSARFILLMFCLASLSGAEAGGRSLALIDADVAANAATVQRLEQAIGAWDTPDKRAVLADARVTQLAKDRDAAQARMKEINDVIWSLYRSDPETKQWVELKDKAEARMEELRKTPGNEAELDRLQADRVTGVMKLEASNNRLVPDMEKTQRAVGLRGAELALRLREVLRMHPDGKSVMVDYDVALKRREALDEERLKLQGIVRPLTYLRQMPKPVFAKTHTMQPLTRFGYGPQDVDMQKELAERWGYCLRLPNYFGDTDLELCASPATLEGQVVALVKSDPKRYKLSVLCNRGWPDQPPQETWCRDASGKVLNAQAKSYDGNLWSPGMDAVISPESPDALWKECGRLRAEPLAALRKLCPIAIVLNGGEYGLGVLGFAKDPWGQDPKVQAARKDEDWYMYISRQKARHEMLISNAVRAAVPDRQLYVYYTLSGGGIRGRWGGWPEWMHEISVMKGIADIASDEHYLNYHNCGYTTEGPEAAYGDILVQALNSKGRNIAVGLPISYSWLWGCCNPAYDRQRWLGCLKALYITGIVGANVGNYTFEPIDVLTKPFPTATPPGWLYDIVSVSRTQALFSHVERFLRNGDLLPGPDKHRFATDQPAYEFHAGDPHARVLARKLKDKPEWLIVAWAGGGNDRPITIEIPDLGTITVQARAIGTLYTATLAAGKAVLKQVPQDEPLSAAASNAPQPAK